jgi:hypothetical protein
MKQLQHATSTHQQAAETAVMERDALSVELKQGNARSRTTHPHVSHTYSPFLLPPCLVAEITRRLEESAKVIQVSVARRVMSLQCCCRRGGTSTLIAFAA